MNQAEFKTECFNKWKGDFDFDDRLNKAFFEFEDWLKQIPIDNVELVKILIQNLKYYSRKTVNKYLEELHKELLDNGAGDYQDTIFAFIKSGDGISNSSNDYWTEYKGLNKINNNICYENIDAITETQWGYIKNIAFIDDFSGSGDSILDELKKDPIKYKGKVIYFITISIMENAMKNIQKYARENDLTCILIFKESQKKAFESNLFAHNDEAKSQLKKMSRKFGLQDRILGYKDSQSLMVFYNNTPNNTLAFIRCNSDSYFAIFPRRDDPKPDWQQPPWKLMNSAKKKRQEVNYKNKMG